MLDKNATEDTLLDRIDQGVATLTSLASERWLVVRDVARDEDCLFSAVQLQLEKLGVQVRKDALRQQLAAYLEEHPYTQHVGTGSCHLRDFLSEAIQSNNSFNADTDQPTEEDAVISSLSDQNIRLQLRWCKYLRRLRSGAWGDHIAVQGLANMLHVDIRILATGNPNMEPITSADSPIGVLHLGLIGQFHYMALDQANAGHYSDAQDPAASTTQSNRDLHLTSSGQELTEADVPTTSPAMMSEECQSQNAAPTSSEPPQSQLPTQSEHVSQEDQEQAEDDAALHHQSQLRGLP